MILFFKDVETTQSEQQQVVKHLNEIKLLEDQRNYQLVSEIVENFYAMLHRKIVDAKLQLSVSEQCEAQMRTHMYHNIFMKFFNIMTNLKKSAAD